MIYSLRHPLRFVKKLIEKPVKPEEPIGHKYAIVAFSEELILQQSPFRNVMHSAMINAVVPNSVFDPIRGIRWIKMGVRRSLNDYEPPFTIGGLSALYMADFAALFCEGQYMSTYKNRNDTMPDIPAEVHELPELLYFPQSGELEVI